MYLPLSFGQERLWFLDQLEPGASHYNIPGGVRLKGKLNTKLLQSSLDQIVARHEVLRTSFSKQEGRPVQVISNDLTFALQLQDLSDLPNSEAEVSKVAQEEAGTGFDLSEGPLIRGRLLTLGAEDHILLVTMHHIVSDGWSIGILIQELAENYQAGLQNRKPQLEELPVQYVDYADWQRKSFETEAFQKQTSYWKEKLSGIEILHVPTDRQRPAVQSFAGATKQLQLDKALTSQLKKYAETSGVSLSMVLLSVFEVLLYRYTGQKNFAIGSPIANRRRKELEGLIGFFVNTIVYRADVSENLAFDELLKRVKNSALEAYDNQDVPFERLVAELNPERDMSYSPLFQVMFVLQNNAQAQLRLGDLELEGLNVESKIAKFDLTLSFEESNDQLIGVLEYNTDLFDASTIDRMSQHFINLVLGILENPKQSIQDLQLVSEKEKHQVLVEWNGTARDYPKDKCVHELFEEQVAKTPDAVAVVFDGQQLTYRELNEKANQLAHYLRKQGVGPDVKVGLCLDRSLELVIGILGVIKAGGAYVPVEPSAPFDRIEYIFGDAEIKLLLTQSSTTVSHVKVLTLDLDQWSALNEESKSNPTPQNSPGNLLYIIYTSGSTGNPKGVLIQHENVTRLFDATHEDYKFSSNDVWTLFHSYSFDFSVWEIWGAFLYGGRLVVVSYAVSRSPDEHYKLLANEGVTVLNQTPSAFYQLMDAERNKFSGDISKLSLRYVIFGGEALEIQKLEDWWIRHGDQSPQLVNMYGITETTVHVSYRALSLKDLDDAKGKSLIGRPILDLQIYLLDSGGQLVPSGISGEMFVGGDGLARGYLNRPDLTAERFIPNPFSQTPGERMYRTGDLARYLPDGNIEYLGRIDNQVKVRGFRIELGEIESALQEQKRVESAVVLAREDTPGQKRLVGYVVGQELNVTEVRDSLKKKLPEYMVPSLFVFLDKLPLTPNGKVDRKALPAPEGGRPELEKAYLPPRTEVESKLCQIWKDVLKLEQVGVYDNFFELGGDSIISIRIIAKANEEGLGLKPRDLFLSPTVAGLASLATQEKQVQVQREDSGEVILSPIQNWFFEQHFEEIDRWNQATLLIISKDVNLEKLGDALRELYLRHPGLRTSFVEDNGRWVQSYIEPGDWKVIRVQLKKASMADQAREIERHGTQIQSSLKLATGEIFKAALFEGCEDGRIRLLMAIHHLTVDEISLRILLEDLFEIYQAASQGKEVTIKKANTFKDWTRELKKYAESDRLKKEAEYWLGVCNDAVMPAKADLHIPEPRMDASLRWHDREGRETGTVKFALTSKATHQLLNQAQKTYRTQINDLLLTALGMSIRECTKLSRFLVNLESHGREDIISGVDISRTVGTFTTLFPVCLDLGDEQELGALIKLVKENLRRIPNKGIGYGLLRYLSTYPKLQRALSKNDRVEIGFNYLRQFSENVFKAGAFQLTKESAGAAISARNHLTHGIDISSMIIGGVGEGDVLSFQFSYNKSRYEESAIEQLAESYLKNLDLLIEHCIQPQVGGYTPSDFPLSKITQEKLDQIGRKDIQDIYPLSPMQQVMLCRSLNYGPETTEFQIQLSWVIEGDLDDALFKEAWQILVDRYDIFRTSFHWAGLDSPLQCVHERVEMPWIDDDCTSQRTPDNFENSLNSDLREGYDFTKAPIMRMLVLKLGEKKRRFIHTHHHILLDAWSLVHVLNEVVENYISLKNGKKPSLAPTFSYRDYISWLSTRNPIEADRYWKELLEGFESASLTGLEKRERNESPNDAHGEAEKTLSKSLTGDLKALSQQHGLTLSSVLQGIWVLLVSRHGGRKDIVIGVVVSGRPPELPQIEEAVGLFINTLPARVKIEESQSVREYLKAFQDQMSCSRQYESSPLWEIQAQSGIPADKNLFEQLFNYRNYPADAKSLSGYRRDLKISEFCGRERWQYPLTIEAMEKDGLWIRLDYRLSRYDADTMNYLLQCLEITIQKWVSNPDMLVSEMLGP